MLLFLCHAEFVRGWCMCVVSVTSVEYDAYRCDLDALQNGPRDSNTMQRIDDAQKRFMQHKEKYDRLKGDVSIKLKFLDENRVSDAWLFCMNGSWVV